MVLSPLLSKEVLGVIIPLFVSCFYYNRTKTERKRELWISDGEYLELTFKPIFDTKIPCSFELLCVENGFLMIIFCH